MKASDKLAAQGERVMGLATGTLTLMEMMVVYQIVCHAKSCNRNAALLETKGVSLFALPYNRGKLPSQCQKMSHLG